VAIPWNYVIRSLNRDKPYARFLMEQLAGDELAARLPLSTTKALDHSQEPEITRELHGVGEKKTGIFGKQSLLAPRLAPARGALRAELSAGSDVG